MNDEVSGRPFLILGNGEHIAKIGTAFRYIEAVSGFDYAFKGRTINTIDGKLGDKLKDAGSHDFSTNGDYDTGSAMSRNCPTMNVAFDRITITQGPVIAWFW